MTDPLAVASTVAELLAAERFDDVEAAFAPRLRAAVSAETLRTGWSTETARIGRVSDIGPGVPEPGKAGLVRVSNPVTGERGALTVVVSVDDAGRLHGLRLAAPAEATWQPPRYARPDRFTEQEVSLRAEAAPTVPGTLTLPRARGPWPGVVLLGGGGPFDRDQTVGPNKPLKDLAWGLASRGVAVLRFDKVTHRHPEVMTAPGFTIVDEYLPHAVAAVRLLRGRAGVDPDRVFVLGHSAGGKVAPRVAAAEPSVSGLVILAGDAAPLPGAAVRAARHLATVQPGPEARDAVEVLRRQAALVDSPDLLPTAPAADLLFGWPASYWLDLRGYDQVASAASVDRPMLIAQGGRDYQVTVDDDLARWRTGLAHRTDVTLRVYAADDHFFFPGDGPSTAADYAAPRHVDPAVVADIAQWLAPRRGLLARLFRGTPR
jgi:uncharacterized protein